MMFSVLSRGSCEVVYFMSIFRVTMTVRVSVLAWWTRRISPWYPDLLD